MGHVLNLTVQDVLCRWRKFRGADIYWGGAVDHGATATEFVVRRMLRESEIDTSMWTKEEWQNAITAWLDDITPKIYRQFEALNLTMDVSEFRSMGDATRLRQLDSYLAELTRAGLIYRGRAVVAWCAELRTTVDKADIVADAAPSREICTLYVPEQRGSAPIDIWIEHPETLVNDAALIVSVQHPLAAAAGPQFVTSPIGRRLPVIVDETLVLDHGPVSAIRLTPGHCAKSFRWASKNGYAITRAYGEDNVMDADPYRGRTRHEARRAIMEEIVARGQYGGSRELRQTRQIFRLSGKPIEELLTEQYFLRTGPLAEGAYRLLKSRAVRVHPEIYHKMLEVYFEEIIRAKQGESNSELADDWCISQQTIWGAPLRLPLRQDSARSVADDQIASMKLSCSLWACSANWIFAGSRDEYTQLARDSILVTGADLVTWWIAPIIMFGSVLSVGPAARDVIIHPIVCDSAGRKMSKSSGNVVNLNDVLGKYGGDALRFSLLSRLDLTDHGVTFNEDHVRDTKALLRRLQRVFSAVKIAGASESPHRTMNDIVSRLTQEIDDAFETFDFKAAMVAVSKIIKRILEFEISDAVAAKESLSLLPLLEPFMPGVIQEARQCARCEPSVLDAK